MARKRRVSSPGGVTGTKQRLITKGIELLEQVGEENFSVRYLAREVLEMSETAPFQHFRTGDELFLAMAQEGFARLADDIVSSVAKPRTPRTRLIAAAAAYVDFSISQPRLYQLMFSARFGLYERKREADPKPQKAKTQVWQAALSLNPGAFVLSERPSTHPYPYAASWRDLSDETLLGEWSRPLVSVPLQYAESHRAFVAAIYELFRSQMLELSDNRNVDDRTLAVTLLLHGLASQLAAGWIRRREGEAGRDLVERYVAQLIP